MSKAAHIWLPPDISVAHTANARCGAYLGTDGTWIAERGGHMRVQQPGDDAEAMPFALLAQLCGMDRSSLEEWRKRGVKIEEVCTDAAAK
jgi:hypothetical protein